MAIPGWALLGAAPVADVLFTEARSQPGSLLYLYLPTLAIALLVILGVWQAGRRQTAELA